MHLKTVPTNLSIDKLLCSKLSFCKINTYVSSVFKKAVLKRDPPLEKQKQRSRRISKDVAGHDPTGRICLLVIFKCPQLKFVVAYICKTGQKL